MFLFTTTLNIIFTAVLLLIYIATAIIINKVIIRRQEAGKKGIIWFYLLLFVLFVVFVGLILWFFGLNYEIFATNVWNSIKDGLLLKIGAIIGSVITVFVAVFIVKIVRMLLKRASLKEGPMKKRMTTILKIVSSIVTYTLSIISILVILALWGVNVLPALAGLGIIGIIIGMGTQSLIKDFISGFFIVFEHHFDVGDIVEINGWKGEVIDIGLKSTKIKNWKQDIKIFANGSIENVINYTLSPSVAIIDFGIAYKEDIQKTIDVLKNELPKFKENFPEVIEDPNVLGVVELADSSVNLRVIVKTQTEKHYAVERAFRQRIKEILDANDIEIPFPQVVVHKPE